ncbi:MAG: thiamine pyrophosphate-dependent enzyme [Candidatus Micrarchaeia archaeon]
MEYFLKGHTACAGCGCALTVRHVLETLGKDIVVVNATGCMEIISTPYPRNNWNVPYIHSLFENVPAVGAGVSRALKKLGKKAIVVCIGGDGATYDIGFGALSGAMERNEDLLYICYDNEAYSNTGLQRSGATPFASATTTSPAEVGGKGEWKKNISFIAAAHAIPYVASASIAFLPDLQAKLKKAASMKGFRFISIHAPCTVGWRIPTDKTLEVSRLAVECGLWNLFEIENGVFKLSRPLGSKPVEEYLKMQGRFAHVTPEQIKTIETHAGEAKLELEKLEKSGLNFTRLL